MASFTMDTVEKKVIEIVQDLIQDWGLESDGSISGGTKLVADLEFASVDIIQLCVAVEEHYRRKMGFQSLLMNDGSYVPDLSISEMADFIHNRINGKD